MHRLILISTFFCVTLNAQLHSSEDYPIHYSPESMDSLNKKEVGIKFIFSRNKTDYDFKNEQGLGESGIFSDHGASFGVEKTLLNLLNKKIELSINLFIDEFNQIGSIRNTFSWNSYFLTGSTSIPLIDLSDSKFIRLTAGVGLSKCVLQSKLLMILNMISKIMRNLRSVFKSFFWFVCRLI